MIHTGLDVLFHDWLHLLRGKRVGLVTHPAAVLPDFTSALDALQAAGAQVTALFGMEHGLAGAAADGAAVADALDAQARIPIYSLYGATREPSAAMLAGVDVLVFDVQDVGVRFYTFISTLYYALRSAGKHGVPVIVLDRPNPINGLAVEGPLLERGLESFVGIAPIPIRHGLTVGELACYFNAEFGFGADLTSDPDGRLAAGDVVRRDRPPLGVHIAGDAAPFDGHRLPWHVLHRGHESVGGPRHGAAVRADRRAVARWPTPGSRPESPRSGWRPFPARRIHPIRQQTCWTAVQRRAGARDGA